MSNELRRFMDIAALSAQVPIVNLLEHAVAKPGDWSGAVDMINTISAFVFQKNWRVVGRTIVDGENCDIAAFNDASAHFVIGKMVEMTEGNTTTQRFGVIFRIEMNTEKPLGEALGYPSLHSVFAVAVKNGLRGGGIAGAMYRWLVNDQKFTIIGDRTQYFGARRLWSRLSQQIDVVVDIVDVKAKTVLERGVMLHHGQYDHEFDKRVWSYGREIESVRVVLRQVGESAAS